MDLNIFILPNEIIHKIIGYLSVYDRLNFGLTCLRFNEFSQHTSFLNEIKLTFRDIDFDFNNPKISLILQTKRAYSNFSFKFCRFDDFQNDIFSSRFGDQIKSLHFDKCCITSDKIVSILKQTKNLETLNVFDSRENLEIQDFVDLKSHLNNVTSFKIRTSCLYTDYLYQLQRILPNLKHLTIMGYLRTPVGYSDPTANHISRVENFNTYIKNQGPKLKSLSILENYLEESSIIYMTKMSNLTLDRLEINFDKLSKNTLICDLIKSQKNLNSLSLLSIHLEDCNVITTCNLLTNLKVLQLNCFNITEEGFAELKKLKKLNTLQFECLNLDKILRSFEQNMIEYKNDNLKKLTICTLLGAEKDDYIFFVHITHLYKNLTELKLDVEDSDDSMLQTIIENLCCLQKLEMIKCEFITDSGITGFFSGISISQLKSLKTLTLLNINSLINELSFVEIAKCNNLEELILNCALINVDHKIVRNILGRCRSLRKLNVTNFKNMNNIAYGKTNWNISKNIKLF